MKNFKLSKYNIILNYSNNKFLYNTYTNKIYKITDNSKIKNFSLEKNTFIEKGFIINKFFNEFSSIVKNTKQLINKRTLLKLTLVPTWDCNFRCDYCFQSHEPVSMNDLIAQKTISFIENNMKKFKKLHIVWWGGEPLLELDRIYYITERLLNITKNYNCSIITNGYLLENIIDKYDNLKIKYIQVTIDGNKEIHNKRRLHKDNICTFDKIINNINLLRKTDKKLEINVRINLDENNIDFFDKIYSELDLKLLKNISLYPAIVENYSSQYCRGNNKTISETFIKKYCDIINTKKYKRIGNIANISTIVSYCGREFNANLTISPEGDIFNCWGGSNDQKNKIGTIDDYFIKKQKINKSFYNKRCHKCRIFPLCKGGCNFIHSKEFCKNKYFIFKNSIFKRLNLKK